MPNNQTAIFGGGCFWCTEAIFQRLRGVESVEPGYAGGTVQNPTYEQVSTGTTGHAEVAKIDFDPEQISYRDLLEVFFATHNPTTFNRQGNDVGPQYRSVILASDNDQLSQAQAIIKELDDQKAFDAQIVTEVRKLDKYYPAEDYHHNYYNQNQNQPYFQLVISPKLKKFKEKFASLLKTDVN